jgi:hypothetical protein
MGRAFNRESGGADIPVCHHWFYFWQTRMPAPP